MPSIAKSSSWFVRVDGKKEFLIDKLKELSNAIDTVKLLSLFHVGQKDENPHCHFVIVTNVVIQQQSFAIRIKKLFDIQKKSEFAIKVWDGSDAACSYMFHEPEEVMLVNKGYTDESINKFRELNKKVQEVIAVNKQRGGRAVTRLVDEFRDNGDTPTRREIWDRMINMIRDGEMYEPGDFKIKAYIEEVYLKTRSKDQWKAYVSERWSRLFPYD